MNPQKMMQQAQMAQQKLREEISKIKVEASTGGGMVTVSMDGNKSLLDVKIDPDAVEDVEMLQDMIRGAVNEAAKRVDEESQRKVSGLLGGMGLPPGLF
ncbi:MAG: YbaB/EbfC family nucleoid-associated protein [Acidobacteria bacterium]|nr:YbaB/EbfC family nucleoid-associated protein [Acidobacteriota bacterium]